MMTPTSSAMPSHPRPPNTYWVTESTFLAGEYPRDIAVETSLPKLGTLLNAGVTFFVDLTEEGELSPYDQLLSEAAAGMDHAVEYRRHPITDMETPNDIAAMKSTLDTIDSALATGHCVYVHCWGGIGRTGTVVGCWLSRHGKQGEEALEALSQRWQYCEKAETRESPETHEQRQYVLNWAE